MDIFDSQRGDDDSDDNESRDEKTKAIRARERARCAAIFMEPAAATQRTLATSLAFNTILPRSTAIAVLKAAFSDQAAGAAVAVPKVSRLDRAMSGLMVPNVGPSAASGKLADDSAEALAAAMVAASRKAAGVANI